MFYVLAIQSKKVANWKNAQLEAATKRLASHDFGSRLKNDLYEVGEFKDFQTPEGWEAGVFSIDNRQGDNSMRKLITEDMLPYGWRY